MKPSGLRIAFLATLIFWIVVAALVLIITVHTGTVR